MKSLGYLMTRSLVIAEYSGRTWTYTLGVSQMAGPRSGRKRWEKSPRTLTMWPFLVHRRHGPSITTSRIHPRKRIPPPPHPSQKNHSPPRIHSHKKKVIEISRWSDWNSTGQIVCSSRLFAASLWCFFFSCSSFSFFSFFFTLLAHKKDSPPRQPPPPLSKWRPERSESIGFALWPIGLSFGSHSKASGGSAGLCCPTRR